MRKWLTIRAIQVMACQGLRAEYETTAFEARNGVQSGTCSPLIGGTTASGAKRNTAFKAFVTEPAPWYTAPPLWDAQFVATEPLQRKSGPCRHQFSN